MIDPQHVVSYEGGDIKITCKSDTPVEWTKKGSENIALSNVQAGRYLIMKNVTVRDSGKYYCFGTFLNNSFSDVIDILIGG